MGGQRMFATSLTERLRPSADMTRDVLTESPAGILASRCLRKLKNSW